MTVSAETAAYSLRQTDIKQICYFFITACSLLPKQASGSKQSQKKYLG